MLYERVPGKSAALTADGGTDGYATLTSNVGFYPGMKGWIVDDNTATQRVLLTELSGSTKIGLRFIAEGLDDPKLRDGTVMVGNMGRSSLAAYTTAQNARVSFDAQVVQVMQPTFEPAPDNTGINGGG